MKSAQMINNKIEQTLVRRLYELMQCKYEMMIKRLKSSLFTYKYVNIVISKINVLNIKKAITIPVSHMQKMCCYADTQCTQKIHNEHEAVTECRWWQRQ